MISRASSSQSVIGRVTQCLRIQQREFISRHRRHCRSAGGHLLLHPVSQRMIYDDSAAADIPSRGLLFVTAFLRWMDCHKPPLFCSLLLLLALDKHESSYGVGHQPNASRGSERTSPRFSRGQDKFRPRHHSSGAMRK